MKRVSIIELFSILYVVYSQYEGILDFDQVKWTDVIDPVTEGTEYDVAKYWSKLYGIVWNLDSHK